MRHRRLCGYADHYWLGMKGITLIDHVIGVKMPVSIPIPPRPAESTRQHGMSHAFWRPAGHGCSSVSGTYGRQQGVTVARHMTSGKPTRADR